MTTSYESGSAMPGRDSEGLQTWNPSVGIFHKPAKVKRESYGGIIGALQDLQTEAEMRIKAYPENFAGIIAAIQDLDIGTYRPGSDTGDKPPGGIINIDINTGLPIWIENEKPVNGQLWFDTRQGRLFVWVEDDWYQTNGADGLPIVTSDGVAPGVEVIVPGTLWYDTKLEALHIWVGEYVDPYGNVGNEAQVTGVPVWRPLWSEDEAEPQTTATLPLDDPQFFTTREGDLLPPTTPGQFNVQKDYNVYLYDSLLALDSEIADTNEEVENIKNSIIIINDIQPINPDPGTLWFDTRTVELNIYYDDGNTQQWVPTSASYAFDESLAPVEAALAAEITERKVVNANHAELIRLIRLGIDSRKIQVNSELLELGRVYRVLDNLVKTDYATISNLGRVEGLLSGRISTLEDVANTLDLVYETRDNAVTRNNDLLELINNRATQAEVDAAIAAIPSVTGFATPEDVANAVSTLISGNGGTITGGLNVRKNNISNAAFDFTGANHYSHNAFKFQTNDEVSTFGNTDYDWEYAWKFDNEEDFCWVYNDSNKVFSITKEGPACSTLYLGDFATNSNDGRTINNKIDVKERLNTYKTALEDVRSAVNIATDFDSLRSGLLTALASV